MIFFTTHIEPFRASTGMLVSPCQCELKDGRKGYFLGDDWREEIEAKGVTVELITKDDLKVKEI